MTQRKVGAPRGWFLDASGAPVERTEAAKTDKPDKAESSDKSSKSDKHDDLAAGEGWKNDVLVRRTGTFLLPIELELGYDDGTKEELLWTRGEQLRSTWWKPLEGRAPAKAKLTSAVIDPKNRYPLDMNLSNNRWYARNDEGTPLRWSERVFTLYSSIAHWFGGIGG